MARVGEHDLSQNEGSEQTLSIRRIITHPSYDDNTVSHDFALLELDTEATLNDEARTICLPSASMDMREDGKVFMVAGWGTLKSQSPSLYIYSDRVCVCSERTGPLDSAASGREGCVPSKVQCGL